MSEKKNEPSRDIGTGGGDYRETENEGTYVEGNYNNFRF